jgi:dipeptidyl aminopeptidase
VLVLIVVGAAAIGFLAATWYSAPVSVVKAGNKHITMDHVFNGTFSANWVQRNWVYEAEDGTYSSTDPAGNIILATATQPNTTSILVEAKDIVDPRSGAPLYWQSWKLSADMKYVLLSTDYVKQWRHSSHSNYWVHRLADHKTFALHAPSFPPAIAYAEWSPVSHAIAYVSGNDLYVVAAAELDQGAENITAVRVTNDGSKVVFNGVPDWVYEEEVFSTDSALWWSPDAHAVAYLRSNETEVMEYTYPVYNPGNDADTVNPYTSEVVMRYPKPGTPLPLVSVHTFDLNKYFSTEAAALGDKRLEAAKQTLRWPGQLPPGDGIVVEVSWVGTDALLVKEIDRAARNGQVVVFQGGRVEGKPVRKLGKDGEEGDDGWIDHGQNLIAIHESGGTVAGYLDVVPKKGWNHIAFFHPVDATEPIWLTDGEWEVTKINGVNQEQGVVFFTAANPSIDRHIYSVELPDAASLADFKPSPKPLTDTRQPGYYAASFSPNAGFYSLAYEGPLVPWQRMIEVREGGINELLEDNAELNATLAEFHRPIVNRGTIESDGFELNTVEILPPNVDTSGRKKYPLLIEVYGGPYSQKVSNAYGRDWHHFLACEQKYVIVKVDGRGTGYKGRQMRNPIMDDIGRLEAIDQAALAREVVKRKYIDRERVGIWGWSYGGYMTLKTLEANPDLFTLGMAVAPVTDWRYYDAIYTERYMNTPEANPDGYAASRVNNLTNFDGKDLLIAHGSGDDNVHFANTASLVDRLTQERVRGWRMRMFTDSDHGIRTRGAYRELYEWMTAFLHEKWDKGGSVKH